MGYRIVYGSDRKIRKDVNRRGITLQTMTAGFLLILYLMAGTFWPQGSELLRSVLLPGEPSAAEVAFSRMVEDLRMGEPLTDAVTAFCREVVADGISQRDSH